MIQVLVISCSQKGVICELSYLRNYANMPSEICFYIRPRRLSSSSVHTFVKKRDKNEKKIPLLYLYTIWSEPSLFDSLLMVNGLVTNVVHRIFGTYRTGVQRRLR